MADPIIRIIIRDENAPGTPPGGPGAPGAPSGRGGQPGVPGEGGGGEGAGDWVGRLLRSVMGGNTMVGRILFRELGLNKMFGDIGRSLESSLQGVLGGAGKGGVPKESQGFSPGIDTAMGKGAKVGQLPEGATFTEGAATGGGAGALAAAAVPVAIAAVLSEAAGIAADIGTSVMRTVGAVGADIASNNPGKVLRDAAGQVAQGLEQIPIVGRGLSALPRIFLSVADAATELKDSFLGRASELAQYSGFIASAQAQRTVNQVFADVREAQALGPGLARLIDAQSRAENALQAAFEPIKQALLEKFAVPVVEKLADMAEELEKADLKGYFQKAVTTGNLLLAAVAPQTAILTTLVEMSGTTDKIWDWMFNSRKEDEKDFGKLMQSFVFDIQTPLDEEFKGFKELDPPGGGQPVPMG